MKTGSSIRKNFRSEEHTSELQSRPHLVCRPPKFTLFPYTTLSDLEDIADELATFKKVFINAKITNKDGEEWKFNEGCLSIPGVREDVSRPETIYIEYFDENWEFHKEEF